MWIRRGEEWPPLCSFLARPVPEAPYPRLNNVEQFQEGYYR